MEEGQINLAPATFNLRNLVREVVQSSQPILFFPRDIEVKVEWHGDKNRLVRGDLGMVSRAIRNILSNAAKYSPATAPFASAAPIVMTASSLKSSTRAPASRPTTSRTCSKSSTAAPAMSGALRAPASASPSSSTSSKAMAVSSPPAICPVAARAFASSCLANSKPGSHPSPNPPATVKPDLAPRNPVRRRPKPQPTPNDRSAEVPMTDADPLSRSSLLSLAILALDVGAARIGVAVKPAGQSMVLPLTVVPAVPEAAGFQKLRGLIDDRQARVVVTGLPLHADPAQAQAIKRFVRRLRRGVSGVRWRFCDETLTSAAAAETARELGERSRSARADDDRAAALILETFLAALPES
jgi:putative holliday junction resolvase